MVKNYVWLILAILLCQGILQGRDVQDFKPIPTQYIMNYLSQSGTKWRGNNEWIKDLKKGVSIETNFSCIRDTQTDDWYGAQGVAVKLSDIFHSWLYINTIKAEFVITQENDGLVIIKSMINETEVITDVQEIEILKSFIKENEKYQNGVVLGQSKDDYSECHQTLIAKFRDATNKDSTNKAKTTRVNSCTTKMPVDLFIKEIEKNRNGFN